MSNNHFIFDKNKCVGCEACVVACVNENGFQSPSQWRNISSSNELKHPGLPLFYFSMACNHCEDAPCMKYCPALAFKRSDETGAVLHIENNCIGCKYCTWQCPYDAPKYNPVKGIVEKCTFCESRLADGQKPACTTLCPTGALDFSNASISKESIVPDLDVPNYPRPSIVIKELIQASGPKIDSSLFEAEEFEPIVLPKEAKINARKEWPLVIFTLIISALIGVTISDMPELDNNYGEIAFLGLGIFGAVLSTLHLGRKLRMWRSILNIKNSWLSREILFFGLFMAVTIIHFYFYSLPVWIFIGSGLALSISIDMLYQPAHWKWKLKIHSAQIMMMSLTLILLLLNQELLFTVILGIRLILFVLRKMDKKQFAIQEIKDVIRITGAFMAAILMHFEYPFWTVIISFALGEILDRIDYYNELTVPDPASLIRVK